eukprot:CAMPEP_0198218510 /NCGR_PEP_ID=MMETSP1445-20131203/69730_1 /TAXON_ID=36898 /ORGANISM="Pyramimonas sp., Strain CCMP2087" /LENGTH=107 /DNA_ID=CAMNT_0043895567 /DNA_START=38 /DNA_END=358 /DNA_ORIENTATION=+
MGTLAAVALLLAWFHGLLSSASAEYFLEVSTHDVVRAAEESETFHRKRVETFPRRHLAELYIPSLFGEPSGRTPAAKPSKDFSATEQERHHRPHRHRYHHDDFRNVS